MSIQRLIHPLILILMRLWVQQGVTHLFTTCGAYVGTCLGNVRAGDEVILLAGCSMPVLLRKSGLALDTYKLQSSLYIPGIMQGEALEYGGFSANDFKEVLLC